MNLLLLQEMNYVGQLAGSVLGRVRDLYKGVNPATLSGSIDVVVVQQPDGSFRSSPFHVRFGKLGILRSTEMTVDIEVNGKFVDLPMRLGENGEAFFIQDVEENSLSNFSMVSPHLPQDTSSLYVSNELPDPSPAFHSPLPFMDTSTRRKNWSKRTTTNRTEDTTEVANKFEDKLLPARDSVYFSFSEIPDISPAQSNELLTTAQQDHLQSSTSRSPSPKSDSELEVKAPGSPLSESCIEWDWGRLPQVSWTDFGPQISQSLPPSPTRELQLPSTPSPDPGLPEPTEECNANQMVPEFGETSIPSCHKDAISELPTLQPDDVLSPDSQEVSLYFPNSDPHPPPPLLLNKEDSRQVPEDNMEPSILSVEMSLCGGLTDTWNISEDRFLKYKISFSDFSHNPSLIENPGLVLRIHNKFYNWATAAPILLCMQVFNQMLPQGVIDQISQQKMPPQSRGWWFSWRRRSLPNQQLVTNPKEYMEQNDDSNTKWLNEKIEDERKTSLIPIQIGPYLKSLRLTSEQIKSLNLNSGANEVVFSICTKFQGTCRTRAQIYLWESTDRIIISDIDGTVTRSDALGHILPQLGKDWTQPGIVQLYNAIYMNDYKFVYCSARSVGLAEITKTFLQGVSNGGFTLPPGPLLLSPSSLFAALHREVIEKTPERFKIACLSDIRQLFTDYYPFYAAFGNRPNDVLAYREVGVPESRIFTVNPKGELTQDLNSSFKTSYAALRDLVNVMFPPPSSHSVSALLSQEFSDFSFWRNPLPNLIEEDIEQPEDFI
ncbi:phosphatidate phosphatase LPIN3-like isoform X2 [Rhinoderma darwinii]|uniref:phosphatidate phosphatase LPIN3-like isoform X2 n=1 Tax=Rhinoderma darwinii TaxID=43563 RepID=UPI003F68215C